MRAFDDQKGELMRRIGLTAILLPGLLFMGGCDQVSDFMSLFKNDQIPPEELTWSQGAPPLQRNLALVLDNSGSMNRNDEQKMMLFSSLVFLDISYFSTFLRCPVTQT